MVKGITACPVPSRLTRFNLPAAQNTMPLLSGSLRLPETRYRIVREGAAQVPVLTGVRRKPAAGRPRVTGDGMALAWPVKNPPREALEEMATKLRGALAAEG